MGSTSIKLIIACLITLSPVVMGQAPRWELVHFPDAPVIEPGIQSPWDSNGTHDPELVWDGTVFRLYYTGVSADNIQRILAAYSFDLAQWFPAGVILEPQADGFDSHGVSDPEILQDNGQFILYYTAHKNNWTRIGRAVSENGVIFDPERQLVLGASYDDERFDFLGVGEPSVVKYNGSYQMVYRGFDGSNWYRLGLATSPDGINFTPTTGQDEKEALFGKGPHGFDDGGATEPEIWTDNFNDIRMLYTSLHY